MLSIRMSVVPTKENASPSPPHGAVIHPVWTRDILCEWVWKSKSNLLGILGKKRTRCEWAWQNVLSVSMQCDAPCVMHFVWHTLCDAPCGMHFVWHCCGDSSVKESWRQRGHLCWWGRLWIAYQVCAAVVMPGTWNISAEQCLWMHVAGSVMHLLWRTCVTHLYVPCSAAPLVCLGVAVQGAASVLNSARCLCVCRCSSDTHVAMHIVWHARRDAPCRCVIHPVCEAPIVSAPSVMCSAWCTLCGVLCMMHPAWCTLYDAPCMMFFLWCTLCDALCVTCSAWCTPCDALGVMHPTGVMHFACLIQYDSSSVHGSGLVWPFLSTDPPLDLPGSMMWNGNHVKASASCLLFTQPHSAILTVLSSQHRPRSTILTAPSSQHRPHSTILTAPFSQHHPHSTIFTAPSSQHHPHSTILTAPFSQHHPHSTILTAPSLQNQPHSALLTAPSSQHRPHSTIFTAPSSQHHPHSTILTAPSSQNQPHSAVLTAPSSQHRPHSTILTAPSSQHHPHSTIFTALFSQRHSHSTILTAPSSQHRPHSAVLTAPSSQHHLHSTRDGAASTPPQCEQENSVWFSIRIRYINETAHRCVHSLRSVLSSNQRSACSGGEGGRIQGPETQGMLHLSSVATETDSENKWPLVAMEVFDPSATPRAPAHHAQFLRHSAPYASAVFGLEPSMIMVEHLHFTWHPMWCAVTLACECAGARGVAEGWDQINPPLDLITKVCICQWSHNVRGWRWGSVHTGGVATRGVIWYGLRGATVTRPSACCTDAEVGAQCGPADPG